MHFLSIVGIGIIVFIFFIIVLAKRNPDSLAYIQDYKIPEGYELNLSCRIKPPKESRSSIYYYTLPDGRPACWYRGKNYAMTQERMRQIRHNKSKSREFDQAPIDWS